MSLAECTARSIAPATSASSISLVNRPLPPASASGRSWMRSPVVRIATISIRSGIESMRRGQRLAHHARLRQRQRAAARAEPQDAMSEDCATGPRNATLWLKRSPPWLYSESRPPATRPPPRWSSATTTGRARSCPMSCCRRSTSMPPFGGVVPEIAARAHVEALDRVIAKAMADAGASFDEHRRRRGGGRARPDRRRHRRADHRQGDRAGQRQAADRGQPSRGACADRAADRRRRRFPIACSSPPAATPRSSRCAASATTCCSAPPSTTPSARPSTRPRSCSASAIPAGRRSRRRRRAATPTRFALPRPMHGRPSRTSRSRD